MLTLGIDEVGRGAFAGPLAVGAVVLTASSELAGDFFQGSILASSELAVTGLAEKVILTDSKKLNRQQRQLAAQWLKENAQAIGVGWVSAAEIDKLGLSKALKLAARRAVKQIPPEVFDRLDQIIIDGTVKLIDDPRATTLIKADNKIAAVSAAAIVAKVARDAYMKQLDQVFPGYDFAAHVGYGTKLHQERLLKLGISPVHRQSFAPISALRNSPSTKRLTKIDNSIGRRAENTAAKYLEQRGHQIIKQNWRTKFCEIDIISVHQKTIYFSEVKYRKNSSHGDGLAAITPKKLKKMRFAAEIFLAKNSRLVQNHDVRLSALSLSKEPPQVDDFIENIS